MKYTVRIDNCIIYTELKNGRYEYSGCNMYLINIMNKLFYEGHLIIFWTEKDWSHLDDILNHLKKAGAKYSTVLMGCPPLDYYIDDRAITPENFMGKMKNENS